MLHSLEIRNYRNLRHLAIEKLGRVNLLVGKNNTGKTSVLEAISIYCQEANLQWIVQLLTERGEFYPITRTVIGYTEGNVNFFKGLFNNRVASYDPSNRVTIGALNSEDIISIRFVKYGHQTNVNEEGGRITRNIIYEDESEDDTPETRLGLQVLSRYGQQIINLERDITDRPTRLEFESVDKVQFVRTGHIIREDNPRLWDRITLTDRQENVEDALRIIDKSIDKLAFINTQDRKSSSRFVSRANDERVAVVKTNLAITPVSLRSMGDGINRILTIILAMVNCEDGYLLIDEFENGLHYSVQEKLWEIIFYLADRLNIQVFATTHSSDTIQSFTSVLAKQSNSKDAGKAIRLQLHNDNVRAVDYSPEELETAVEYNIEVR